MQCQLCKQSNSLLLLDLQQQPLANKYPTPAEFAQEDFYPLQVYFCRQCRNVQLGTVISRDRMFKDYYYLSSVNPGLVRHFQALAKKLAGARLVLDIGSNDGILLKPLQELGVKAVGVEPSINVSKIANDQGLTTINAFFDAAAVERVKRDFGRPDVVVASSVFTHLEDPHQFIEDVKSVLAEDGCFIVEVEYIGNILAAVQFERFYLDRLFYYSLTSLDRLCAGHGLSVTDVEPIEPHGGSLRVTIRPGTIPPCAAVTALLREEAASLRPARLEVFKQTVDANLAAFRAKLEEYQAAGLKVAGYGAPARVATICNYGRIGPELIEFIVDDSPLKQNRHSPGTHIPIVPASHLAGHRPDVLVIFAYEYFDDIKKKLAGSAYRYLIPIPPREVA